MIFEKYLIKTIDNINYIPEKIKPIPQIIASIINLILNKTYKIIVIKNI